MSLASNNTIYSTTALRVFHPSDFSDSSQIAFVHALKLALESGGKLTILHTGNGHLAQEWSQFPHVRQTLERWEKLPPHSPVKAMEELGLDVVKVVSSHDDVERGILSYLKNHPHDLLVLATHQYDGIERWRHHTIAEPLARHMGAMTLFIPQVTDGFIALESGAVALRNILIPIDRTPDPQAAVQSAVAMAQTLEATQLTFTTLYVGADSFSPDSSKPWHPNWKWHHINRTGRVEETILHAAQECHADLIVMATAGHHGLLDALRGSTTERIVRQAHCPVLAVPAAASTKQAVAQESVVLLPSIS